MNSTQRRQKLFYFLQSGKALSVQKIANEFGVSRRTVYRDLRLLQDADVPLTYDPDHGYGIMRNGTIPPLMFTTKQLATIMMGLSFVKSQVDETLGDDAREVELKINSVVPGELKDFMNALEKKTIVDPHASKKPLRKKGGNWFTVCTAISTKKPIEFSYKDKKENISERVIDPLLLVFYSDHWNVIGYCHKRKEPRSFIMDRMADVTLSEKSHLNMNSYTPEDLLYRKIGNKEKVELIVRKSIINNFLSSLPVQLIEQVDAGGDAIRIIFDFDNMDYLNRWLFSFADAVKIIQPDELKVRRKKILQQMMMD